ncbi:MarC family protein [Aliikangiella coralliicola]|uniref:UPF0056 membrane protein n=1 Tax=Aliikangiella coralliicola TaxID=2592383 RepID=A0A545UH89_9GAMM|nr:MarC family protein [Aliikangiella coralliicola]TQV88837.1 MarC family protein [Aliikangiella coralliicola]
MYELFISSFVTFFVVIDPLGIAPIFAVMTEGASASFKRSMIIKSVITGSIILLLFAFVGNALLSALGISLLAFKTAGGVLLFLIALDMVFEKRTERREKASAEFSHEASDDGTVVNSDDEYDDISVFPMAIPFMAGPGSIAYIMLLMSNHSENLQEQGVVIGSMLSVLLLTVMILLAATKIIAMMGQTVANAITRILGVLLAALATQYMFDGIKGAFL